MKYWPIIQVPNIDRIENIDKINVPIIDWISKCCKKKMTIKYATQKVLNRAQIVYEI